MANQEDSRSGLELTQRGLLRNGIGWIPVSGEIHYSRVPRGRWRERIRQMRAGGITVIACYVPWIHHSPDHERANFDGNRDIAAFIDLVREEELDIVLRLGPWAHGELRNGGFPDWVQEAPVAHRTNDPAYLALVRDWWTQLAVALDGRANPETILGLQLENEMYDGPDHIVELKRIARSCGFSAPFWTATAWGGALLPEGEVFPLYGGYGDGFWVDSDAEWDASFRDHYFFSHVWDDPGIGADLRSNVTRARATTITASLFPPATCELGGGMATAYHRRPLPSAEDVATIAHCKIGNGSAWQGYYMYAGGTNPAGGLQESHATNYPNDMPPLSYDFHAPISESGRLSRSHATLRRQHAFLACFGDRLVDMPSHLPGVMPDGVADTRTLRWAFRGNDTSGFLFIAWHQPYKQLEPYAAAEFQIDFAGHALRLPSKPMTIPVGTAARWPVNLTVDGITVDWLTATALTILPGRVRTLVAIADAGVGVELSTTVEGTSIVEAIEPGLTPIRLQNRNGGQLDLLVLPDAVADQVWVQEGHDATERRLLLSADDLTWDPSGRVSVRSAASRAEVLVYSTAVRAFENLPVAYESGFASRTKLSVTRTRRPAHPVSTEYGNFEGRPSAPSPEDVERLAHVFRIEIPQHTADDDACLEVEWEGDVAELRVDGRTASDRFWDGSVWRVNLHDAGFRPGSVTEIWVTPMHPRSRIWLPAKARERKEIATLPFASIVDVRLSSRSRWVEA